jgi:hypothetical protein
MASFSSIEKTRRPGNDLAHHRVINADFYSIFSSIIYDYEGMYAAIPWFATLRNGHRAERAPRSWAASQSSCTACRPGVTPGPQEEHRAAWSRP